MNNVKIMSGEEQERLRGALRADGAAELLNGGPGVRFAMRSQEGVVTAYYGGKVLFQGKDSVRLLSLADEVVRRAPFVPGEPLTFPVVGGDESGKGDLFGPLVVAAFAARDEAERSKVIRLGARDCKLMTDDEVRSVGAGLRGLGASSVRVVMPDEYNERYARVHNVNVLLNQLYGELLLGIATRVGAQTVILDKYGSRALGLWSAPQGFRFIVEPHAERYPEVAAASVLARAAFLEGLQRTARENGLPSLPKGASTETQAFMRRLAAERGRELLQSVAKVNFAPVKEYLEGLF